MVYEIVAKITDIAQNARLSEADIQHLFALARKLVERVPEAERPNYGLVKLYGDWTVHSKIDRSRVGAGVLQQVADVIFQQMTATDTDKLVRNVTKALSFDKTREQLNALVARFDGSENLFGPDYWRGVVPILVEIISSTPLTIAPGSRFQTFLNAIRAKPLKGTSVIKALELVKIPTSVLRTHPPIRSLSASRSSQRARLPSSSRSRVNQKVRPILKNAWLGCRCEQQVHIH